MRVKVWKGCLLLVGHGCNCFLLGLLDCARNTCFGNFSPRNIKIRLNEIAPLFMSLFKSAFMSFIRIFLILCYEENLGLVRNWRYRSNHLVPLRLRANSLLSISFDFMGASLICHVILIWGRSGDWMLVNELLANCFVGSHGLVIFADYSFVVRKVNFRVIYNFGRSNNFVH